MRGRITERSSILLLGRNTVVIGAVAITIVSFGLGYFFGYRGTDSGEPEKAVEEKVEKEVKESPKKAEEKQPDDEKRVLEASPVKESPRTVQAAQPITPPSAQPGAPIVPPPPAKTDSIKPPEPIPEVAPRKPADASRSRDKEPRKADQRSSDAASKNRGPEGALAGGTDKTDTNEKAASVKSPRKRHAAAPSRKKVASKAKVPKPAAAAAKRSAQKAFTVQLGAFPTREGAEQLLQGLKAKGYKPYIAEGEGDSYFRVRVGSFSARKDAERSAADLTKQTGLQNYVTVK